MTAKTTETLADCLEDYLEDASSKHRESSRSMKSVADKLDDVQMAVTSPQGGNAVRCDEVGDTDDV